MLNSIAIASDYAGRDPQAGTSDGSFFSKFSFMLKLMVKILLQLLKRKEKNGVIVNLGRKWQIEKMEKLEMNMYKEIEKD